MTRQRSRGMPSHVRAQRALEAAHQGQPEQVRGEHRLVLTEPPAPLLDGRTRVPVGVHCKVRLYRNDVEVPVGPERNIVRPPMERIEASGLRTIDPWGALWDVLWACVLEFPEPEAWRAPPTGKRRR